jgi:PKD domain
LHAQSPILFTAPRRVAHALERLPARLDHSRLDAIILRPSTPALLSATIAALAVGGLVLVASATRIGTAPGNGEKIFDAPGCQPNAYDGPGPEAHYLMHRDCPTPTPVIVAHTSYAGGVWRVAWDGSRSFDPVGGRLVRYAWSVGAGPQRLGARISVRYARPGLYSVKLYVTDDSGSTGTAQAAVRLG